MKCRNNYILLVIMTFMFSLMLLGCDSETTTETVKSKPEAVVKEETPKVAEVEVPEEAAVEEPVEDLYIPEGIDMASTLPGEKWVAFFAGKVMEPVVVIYNDNTGRKEVAQAGSEITINPDQDMITIFLNEIDMGHETHAISIKESIASEYYHVIIMDSAKMREIPKRPASVTITNGREEWVIEFLILVE